jgi:hypothetical protein
MRLWAALHARDGASPRFYAPRVARVSGDEDEVPEEVWNVGVEALTDRRRDPGYGIAAVGGSSVGSGGVESGGTGGIESGGMGGIESGGMGGIESGGTGGIGEDGSVREDEGALVLGKRTYWGRVLNEVKLFSSSLLQLVLIFLEWV